MKIVRFSDHIIAIENFWSHEKCDTYRSKFEFDNSGIAFNQNEGKESGAQSTRSHQRVLFHDKQLAHDMWQDLKELVLEEIDGFKAQGINDMFRCYRYEAGYGFIKHRDQSFFVDKHETSFYTVMVYLNDEFEGGETLFEDCTVSPKKGMCLLFLHDLEHEGLKVSKSQKYYLRTDVMYRHPDKD